MKTKKGITRDDLIDCILEMPASEKLMALLRSPVADRSVKDMLAVAREYVDHSEVCVLHVYMAALIALIPAVDMRMAKHRRSESQAYMAEFTRRAGELIWGGK